MFLDDELAETVLQFQAELQAVWNDVVGNNKMASEETRKFLANTAAADPMPGNQAKMAAIIKSDTERWAGWLKLANIKPE